MAKAEILVREFQFPDIDFLSDLTNALGYATTVEQIYAFKFEASEDDTHRNP